MPDIPQELVEKAIDALDQAFDDVYAEDAPEMVSHLYRRPVQERIVRAVLEAVLPQGFVGLVRQARADYDAKLERVRVLYESMARTGYPDALVRKGQVLDELRAALEGED